MKYYLEYFLKNVELHYLIDREKIGYGESKDRNIFIQKSVDESFFNAKKNVDPEKVIWKKWKDTLIPFPFDPKDDVEIVTELNGQIRINYDIVAASIYFLSGWDEYVNKSMDDLGRISYDSSIVNKLGIAQIPVVNYYFDILEYAFSKLNKEIESIKVNKFSVVLTHDIDTCRSAWLQGSMSELKKKRFLSIPKLLFKRFFLQDDWFNFSTISNLEAQYGAKSTFFFLPQKGKIDNLKNADYDVTSSSIQIAIKNLKTKNHEIGVHGSFGTHVDSEMFARDMKKIGVAPIIGNRFHFLMFHPVKTIRILEKCEIKYDTSLGFAERIGFRRGTCYPFYLYDFENDKISNVLEFSTHLMDRTLQHKKYMNMLPKDAFLKIRPIIDEVIKFNGVLTVLWHNIFFSDYKYTGWREVYEQILEYCAENNAQLVTGQHIYENITSNQRLEAYETFTEKGNQ